MLGGFYFFKKKKSMVFIMHIKIIGLKFKTKERNVVQRYPLLTNDQQL